jgi:hypothetical protein
MLRFLARFIGFWLVAAALVAAVIDGSKSIAASALVITPLAESWAAISALAGEPAAAPAGAESSPLPWPLDLALSWFLSAPTVLALAVAGVVFLILGAKRRGIVIGREFA